MDTLQEAQYLASRLDRREISRETFAQLCSKLIAEAVGCRMAGLWLTGRRSDEPETRCLANYDVLSAAAMVIEGSESGSRQEFLAALARDGHVCAIDTRTHPATAQLYRERLARNDIRSMMTVAFSINGSLRGSFSCCAIGEQMHWTAHQLAMLKRIAARVAPALARAASASDARATEAESIVPADRPAPEQATWPVAKVLAI